MCGIVGYIGDKLAHPVLLDGLRQLEYRGYDSAGIAVYDNNIIADSKALGQVKNLAALETLQGTCGIAHTRWATHGGVTVENTHPHFDTDRKIAVVHNGIIENYVELRRQLQLEGVVFRSETDTEVIPHLLRKYYKGDPIAAMIATTQLLRGTYGIVAIFSELPQQLVFARNGSPLVVGGKKKEYIIASDPMALARYTRDVVYIEDGDIGVVTNKGWEILSNGDKVNRKKEKIPNEWQPVDMGGFDHFMLKEIYEQPESLRRCMTGRLLSNDAKLGGLNFTPEEIVNTQHLGIVSCGTSYHAGLVAAHAFEELARLRTNVEVASELRYRTPPISTNDMYLGVSQSGETADTLQAIKSVKKRGAKVAGIINVVGSTIARECGQGVYIHSGPEMAVASTKAFTSQVAALTLVALSFGMTRGLSSVEGYRVINALDNIPDKIDDWLKNEGPFFVEDAVDIVKKAKQVFFIGRGVSAPVAMEGALKLKEISYIPSFAYPAGEMKHGPIAMIDDETPVIAIIPRDHWREKTISNVIEAKARGAKIISVCGYNDSEVEDISDVFISVDNALHHLVSPLLTVVPLQILAYRVALELGRNIDRPRNLAKSVTVE